MRAIRAPDKNAIIVFRFIEFKFNKPYQKNPQPIEQ